MAWRDNATGRFVHGYVYVLNGNYSYIVKLYHINYLLLLTIPLHSFITIVVMEFVWYFMTKGHFS